MDYILVPDQDDRLSDADKKIEATAQVEKKEVISIAALKRKISIIDGEIARSNAKKQALVDQINAIVVALDLRIE